MNFDLIEKLKDKDTVILTGIPSAPGYAIGKCLKYEKEKFEVYPSVVLDVNSELEDFQNAIEKSKKELRKIIDEAKKKIYDDKMVSIFEAQLMVLEDPQLIDAIKNEIIKNKHSADYSIHSEFSKYIEPLQKSNDISHKERAKDIEDIKLRIIRNLRKKRWESKLTQSRIIFAHELSAADALLFVRNEVLAYVAEGGSLTSHAALIARALNIPAVFGIENVLNKISSEDEVIVDGFHGLVIKNPGPKFIEYYRKRIIEYDKLKKDLSELINVESKTKDNVRVKLYANMDLLSEIPSLIAFGAEGIGLFRTENLFFDLGDFPSELEQTEIYSSLAEKLYPKILTIRTFDLGGDKINLMNYKEANPFLGWRGIRVLLDNKPILKNQLRAILKASIYKNVRVMIPMISSVDEIVMTKEVLEEVKNELSMEKVRFDENIPFGIMIEVPSIVCCLNEVAQLVDFVSVGTNDLTQYLLAVDRANQKVFKLYQQFHPSVFRTLKVILNDLKETKIEVSICGELASNFMAIPLLIGLGYRYLSVNEYLLLQIKKLILSLDASECEDLANKVLNACTQDKIITIINEFMQKIEGIDYESL